jgi:hypothetical protein
MRRLRDPRGEPGVDTKTLARIGFLRNTFHRQRERANYVEFKNYSDATTFGASSAKGKGDRVAVILTRRTLLHCDAI